MIEKYMSNNLNNPTYLFHGSPKLLEEIEQRQATDSNHNLENEDYAVFLTSSYLVASAYAFKDKIKQMSDDLPWDFQIGGNARTGEINIVIENVNIDDNLEGYIYVFPFEQDFKHNGNSIQYKCHRNITPIDRIKIKFSDFKEYYIINQNSKHL